MLKKLAKGPFVPKDIINFYQNSSNSTNNIKKYKSQNIDENYLSFKNINYINKNNKKSNLQYKRIDNIIKDIIQENNLDIKGNYNSIFSNHNYFYNFDKIKNLKIIKNDNNILKRKSKSKKNFQKISKKTLNNQQQNNFYKNKSYTISNKNYSLYNNDQEIKAHYYKIKKKIISNKRNDNNLQFFYNSFDNKILKDYNLKYNILKSKSRIKNYSKLLENLRDFGQYNLLINDRKNIKIDLERNVSDLTNSIKVINRTTHNKEMECFKINEDNEKILLKSKKNRAKSKKKELNEIKKDNIFLNFNDIYNAIKCQTMEINKEILKKKDEIKEINNNIKVWKKDIYETKIQCDKMRKDIYFYKNHLYNLKENLKIMKQKNDKIELIFKEINKDHSK